MGWIIPIIGLAFAIPIGIFIKMLTKEELKKGKFYFIAIFSFSIVLLIVSLFLKETVLKNTLTFQALFMAIVSGISAYQK